MDNHQVDENWHATSFHLHLAPNVKMEQLVKLDLQPLRCKVNPPCRQIRLINTVQMVNTTVDILNTLCSSIEPSPRCWETFSSAALHESNVGRISTMKRFHALCCPCRQLWVLAKYKRIFVLHKKWKGNTSCSCDKEIWPSHSAFFTAAV